ncbi:hypothetical protein BN2475_440012 [Paraburkholderia ribeironis]|uniref:Uncharacterized protein n=1 Tax=Paraburkholderia ribeironis TaxID=1247936 RepID=A0A1N7S986_9BURK|nr:hypothetical protein BN2475_440012 [Paraburkholderia ribeironis]
MVAGAAVRGDEFGVRPDTGQPLAPIDRSTGLAFEVLWAAPMLTTGARRTDRMPRRRIPSLTRPTPRARP